MLTLKSTKYPERETREFHSTIVSKISAPGIITNPHLLPNWHTLSVTKLVGKEPMDRLYK